MATDKKSKTKDEQPDVAITTTQPAGALVEYDYGDDEGAGFEHQTAADYSIPFLVLLQALSPQVTKRVHPMALPGNLYNTVTEQYYDGLKGVLFVPGTTRRMFARWVPRDEGGGFRGQLLPEDPAVLKAIEDSKKFGKYLTPDEEREGKMLQLSETHYVYGALCDEDGGTAGMALIAFTSTKIANCKLWKTRMRNLEIPRGPGKTPGKPPMWANLTRITADTEKNNKGEFYVFKMSPGDPRGMLQSLLLADDPRFQLAKQCAELVGSGQAKVDYSKSGGDEEDQPKKTPF